MRLAQLCLWLTALCCNSLTVCIGLLLSLSAVLWHYATVTLNCVAVMAVFMPPKELREAY